MEVIPNRNRPERIGHLAEVHQHQRAYIDTMNNHSTSPSVSPEVSAASSFRVTVRNKITGDIAVVEWEADCGRSAQIQVLHMLFRHRGWWRAVAMVPEVVETDAAAA